MNLIRPFLSPPSSLSALSVSLLLVSTLLQGCLFGGSSSGPQAISCSKAPLQEITGLAGRIDDSAQKLGVLTQRMILLGESRDRATGDDRREISRQLAEIASQRSELLGALLLDNPAEILRGAMPIENRLILPAAARACLESETVKTGTVQAFGVDGDRPGIEYLLVDDDGNPHALSFVSMPPVLDNGERIRVRGVRLPCARASAKTGLAAMSEATPIVVRGEPERLQEQAAITSHTFGAQNTAVILLSFTDKASTYNAADAQSTVFGQVSDFYREASFGQTWITGQAYGPYAIPIASTACNTNAISSAARAAAQSAGVDLSTYKRLIYVFPQNTCAWLGLGTIGGWPSETWINASMTLHTVAHELGHNLGLYHSNALDCGRSSSIATSAASCTSLEYADTTDVMGNRLPGHFTAYQKERIGWLNYGISPPIATVSSDGNYSIEPYETPSSNPKALKILKSTDATTGAKTYYYLEYRQQLGFDSVFGSLYNTNNLTRGISVHTGSTSTGNSSYLIQMNPSTGSWYQSALNLAQSFIDTLTGTAFSLSSADSSGAWINVTLGNGQSPCVHSAPSITISPRQSAWVSAGTPVQYTVTVRNQDTESCTASDFALTASAMSGGSAALGSGTLTISPGNEASTTVRVTTGGSAAPGTYSFSVGAASTSAGIGGGSAIAYNLIASPSGRTVSIIPDQISYRRGGEIDLLVSVAVNGAAGAGQSYAVILTGPDGTQIVRNGVSGSDGTFLHSFRIADCAATGTYAARVEMSGAAPAQISVDIGE